MLPYSRGRRFFRVHNVNKVPQNNTIEKEKNNNIFYRYHLRLQLNTM
jgi:hypothetical protein